MKIKQTMRSMVLGAILLFAAFGTVSFIAQPAYAQESCGGIETAIIKCDQSGQGGKVEDTGIWGILILTINILTAGVGVLAVAGFVYGGILYITSGGSPEQVKKSRTIFTNVVIGIIAFGGMFALLNFIVPGGVFN